MTEVGFSLCGWMHAGNIPPVSVLSVRSVAQLMGTAAPAGAHLLELAHKLTLFAAD